MARQAASPPDRWALLLCTKRPLRAGVAVAKTLVCQGVMMVAMTKQEREELVAEIAVAVRIRATDTVLTDDELRWVRLAIQREAQSIELRKAIIEKSLAGLVWMCILGIGSVLLSWATAHGFKP